MLVIMNIHFSRTSLAGWSSYSCTLFSVRYQLHLYTRMHCYVRLFLSSQSVTETAAFTLAHFTDRDMSLLHVSCVPLEGL